MVTISSTSLWITNHAWKEQSQHRVTFLYIFGPLLQLGSGWSYALQIQKNGLSQVSVIQENLEIQLSQRNHMTQLKSYQLLQCTAVCKGLHLDFLMRSKQNIKIIGITFTNGLSITPRVQHLATSNAQILYTQKNSACTRPMQNGNTGDFPFCNHSRAFIRLTSIVGLCWSPSQTKSL